MARRQAFVYRHPLVTLLIILVVEVLVITILHLVLGWSLLAVVLACMVVLGVVTFLMG